MPFEPTPEELLKMGEGFFYWQGIPTLLGCELEQDPAKADIVLVGLPWTSNLIERTQYLGPRAVRHRSKAYHRKHREFQVDPFELARIRDFGDVPIQTLGLPDQAVLEVEQFYAKLDGDGAVPFTIGGDHACTLPVLRAIAGPGSCRKGPIGMIHFDSHSDTYGAVWGITHHAGAGFKIGKEEGLIDPERCVQVGLNGPMSDLAQEDFSKEAGYRLLPLTEIREISVPAAIAEIRCVVGEGPTFISFDLDVLTLSDAPAVADPEAGGLTINEVFQMLRGFRGMEVVGGDIVCFVPHLDPSMITAIHASAIMHDIVTLMAEAVARKREEKETPVVSAAR
ncbi:MAG: arginase family protein [Rubrobacter sp.]|nr:arginase family protein [Rubrobacter sp.]